MVMGAPRWSAVEESAYPWERKALEFLRQHLPNHDPWRVWANAEFVDDEGRVNEIDALVLSPHGLFSIEIKSRPGTVEGDAHSWTWVTEGRRHAVDNPLLLANRKAKRLASLPRRQQAIVKGRMRAPWVEALVFLSAVRPPLKLDAALRSRVFLPGRPAASDDDGIIAGMTGALVIGSERRPLIDANFGRAIARAVDQAGIRPALRLRRISDYELGELLAEGEGWQDWVGRHVTAKVERRIRVYSYARAASKEARARLGRMAEREFQILEGIEHPGILKVLDFKETDRGPALIFEHDPNAVRFDFFLRDHTERLTVEARLELVRQLAEALHYAHEKRLYHRALSPQSVLVRDAEGDRPRLQVMNWQTAARSDSTAATPQRTSGTLHLDQYVDDLAKVYLAPETLHDPARPAPHYDVFSLGAIAYHLFTDQPPADSPVEVPAKLKMGDGLRLSQVVNGAHPELEELIRASTDPKVASRIDSVGEFLEYLGDVERRLRLGLAEDMVDPSVAKPGDELDTGESGRFVVVHRLGRGGSADAILVKPEGGDEELVLKVAVDAPHSERLRAEAEVLGWS